MIVAAGLALATLAIATPATRPDVVAVRMVWEAPSGCPDAKSLAQDLSGLTHGTVAATFEADGLRKPCHEVPERAQAATAGV